MLKTHGHAAFLELTQKHVKDRDILNLAHDIIELLENYQISRELYQHMLQYIVNCGESQDYQTFLKVIIDHSTAKYQEDTMTIAEQLRREGYSKGIHVGIEQGMQKGKAEGKAEGEYTAKLNVARNMLINHFDYDTIKEMTGLSSLDLSKLINNH